MAGKVLQEGMTRQRWQGKNEEEWQENVRPFN
jgi:hypothetical protein